MNIKHDKNLDFSNISVTIVYYFFYGNRFTSVPAKVTCNFWHNRSCGNKVFLEVRK